MSESNRVVFNILMYIGENLGRLSTFQDDIIKILDLCGVEQVSLNSNNPERAVTLSERLYLKFECNGKITSGLKYSTMAEIYSALQRGWIYYVPQIIADKYNRPWLNFRSDQAYCRIFKNFHKECGFTYIKLGTLISQSHFVTHLEKSINEVGFFHDSRKIVIEHSIEIKYFSIKNILVNGNQWIIHFLHTPLVYVNGKHFCGQNIDPDVLGRCNAILLQFPDDFVSLQILSRLHFTCRNLGLKINYVPFEVTARGMQHISYSKYLPNICGLDSFETNYLVEAIFRRTYAPEIQGYEELQNLISSLHHDNSRLLNEALKELINNVDSGLVLKFKEALQQLFIMKTKNQDINLLEIVPERTKLVKRAVITPTRVLLYPPELVITNRILRKFDINSALRVSFRDDNLNKFSQSSGRHIDELVVSHTVKRVFWGIHIANRKFEFLAWSNSQIRDHGLWLYAMDSNLNTANSIQRWMGDFSKIKIVAKFAARMGQCFSQTEETVTVPLSEGRVKTQEDIKGQGIDPESKEHYVFSDGVGKISLDLAKKVCKKLEISKVRSAYQIRYSGFKGMLVIDPALADYDIVFRECMKKFECESSQTLEIVKIAQACGVTLNRPLVTILDQMGIEHSVFLKIQNETLQEYTNMLLDDKKAVSYLAKHHNMPNIVFSEFVPSGIYPTVEPFFRSMLLCGHKFDIGQIMKKARIPIDPADGRNMFGVLDETSTLNYGEVFVQYTTHILGQETNEKTLILKGKVLVTKNPCYQPGDVRVLKAIDVPNLHHIVDCIVFPQKGKRPHPNEMSGSDLDGDEYTVIWKDHFIFKKLNARARHCPVPKKIEHPNKIMDSDLLDFFTRFILSDRIGPLASAHLATADKFGLYSPQCQRLARDCSVAVDFSKSGQAKELEDKVYVTSYPDFMEKWDKITYRSDRALGKLYRSCRSLARLNLRIPLHYKNVVVDPLLKYPGWEKYESSAIESLNKYNSFFDSILTNYGVVSESEAMTGLYSRLHGRFSVKNGRNEVEELIKILIKSLWQTLYNDFHAEFNADVVSDDEVNKKASAWYVVTYRENKPKYLSFPWIISNYLLGIKTNAIENGTLHSDKPVINELENMVECQLGRVGLLPDRTDENYIIEKARKLVEVWANYNCVSSFEILKLFSVAGLHHSDYNHSINLVFDFFKFIVNLSLREKSEIKEKLSSCQCYLSDEIINSLGKEAMYSYQYVAVKKELSPFGLAQRAVERDRIEMEPKTISQDVIKDSNQLIDKTKLTELSNFLRSMSGVENVESRLEEGKILIIAYGFPDKIEKLEELIGKGSESLKNCI